MDLLVDIEKKIREGKGGGCEVSAKAFNVKQISKSILFLQEHGIRGYKELTAITDETMHHFNELSDSINQKEERLSEIRELQKTIIKYSKTRIFMLLIEKLDTARNIVKNMNRILLFIRLQRKSFLIMKKAQFPKEGTEGRASETYI